MNGRFGVDRVTDYILLICENTFEKIMDFVRGRDINIWWNEFNKQVENLIPLLLDVDAPN